MTGFDRFMGAVLIRGGSGVLMSYQAVYPTRPDADLPDGRWASAVLERADGASLAIDAPLPLPSELLWYDRPDDPKCRPRSYRLRLAIQTPSGGIAARYVEASAAVPEAPAPEVRCTCPSYYGAGRYGRWWNCALHYPGRDVK